MDYIIGFFLGLLSSILVWLVPSKIIVPKLIFSEEINRKTRPYQTMPRYRFYLTNNGRREVFDINIFFKVRIKGLMKDEPDVYEIVNINVGSSGGYVVKVAPKSKVRLAILPHKCKRFSEPYFPNYIQEKYEKGILSLDDVFKIGTEVDGRFIAYGYDKWSGARKFFESNIIYTSSNIVDDLTEIEKDLDKYCSYDGGEEEE